MRRGFFNGILVGSAAGLIMSALLKNKMRPNMATRHLLGHTRKLGRRTGKMVTNVARDVQEFIQR